ncbi:hypothetical protein [Methanoregula sp.]|uniref:hypothetical protein n=1 Tax=Methanoregula sp. TaxID=2052170 RepID=UPI003BB1A7B1
MIDMARDPVAEYHDDENERRFIEHENEWAHSEAGQYEIRYNDARYDEICQRNEEIQVRNDEIRRNLINLYTSRGIIILIISIVLSALTFGWSFNLTIFIIGLVVWNVVILFILYGYCHITAKTVIKTEIRPEITDRTAFIQMSAREKAYRK